jgi:hypothetical protein
MHSEHHSVLLIFAFVFFVIATFFNYAGSPAAPGQPWYQGRFYVHMGWLGMACWIASMIF